MTTRRMVAIFGMFAVFSVNGLHKCLDEAIRSKQYHKIFAVGDFIEVDGTLSEKNVMMSYIRCFIYLKSILSFSGTENDNRFFSQVLLALSQAASFLDKIDYFSRKAVPTWRGETRFDFPFLDGAIGSCCAEPIDYSFYISDVIKSKIKLEDSCASLRGKIEKMLVAYSEESDQDFQNAVEIFHKISGCNL